jgi:hypothetical protein
METLLGHTGFEQADANRRTLKRHERHVEQQDFQHGASYTCLFWFLRLDWFHGLDRLHRPDGLNGRDRMNGRLDRMDRRADDDRLNRRPNPDGRSDDGPN